MTKPNYWTVGVALACILAGVGFLDNYKFPRTHLLNNCSSKPTFVSHQGCRRVLSVGETESEGVGMNDL